MTTNQRKLRLINPVFQISYLSHMLGVAAVVSLCYALANYYFFRQLLSMGNQVGLPPEHAFYRFIEQQKTNMNWIYVFTSLAIFSFICLFGLYISHRIAGPIHKLQVYLQNYKNGRRGEKFSLRQGDYFRELEDAVNNCLSDPSTQGSSLRIIKK
jgi:sensor histidine kinase YesM